MSGPMTTMDRRDRHDHGRRNGAVVAGTWLIGIGLIFLVKDAMDLGWPEAWPLFVVVAGAASLVSSLTGRRRHAAGAWSLVWPIAWMLIGAILFASTTGRIAQAPGELISRWWPAVIVGIGIWFLVAAFWPRKAPAEQLALPLAGAQHAEVRVQFGAGELSIGRAEPGMLVSGRFEGGAQYRSPGPGLVELRPDEASGWPMTGGTLHWTMGLTGEVPLDLRLDTGASKARVDLVDLRIRLLEIRSGAAETRVRLPAGAGQSWVRTETGVASLHLDVPSGVAARIRTKMALGRTDVDEVRFPRTMDGFMSPDYERSPNRVEIEIQGGVGSVTVR